MQPNKNYNWHMRSIEHCGTAKNAGVFSDALEAIKAIIRSPFSVSSRGYSLKQ